ncbi:hypothetical protein IQ254_15225 [Nodosilinea sp. LEGE 07088]|uniref:Coq4 family protein n=1 Tax=Nodosilinea sp. LEGE 07088 TaxID=2777968 RepID=UPI001880156D|nr:Coq4 family protein [Nodosilinea sp. LEGE 07088]MBE9138525.1 hypothetical protein [Nodosilinea sp. LEGE 07088]
MTAQTRRIAKPRLGLNPLSGLHWPSLGAAYRAFLTDPAAGILHILKAGRNSQWERWVERRLARQASHLANRTISVDLEALVQLPPSTLGGAYARHMMHYGFKPETFVGDDDAHDWLRQRTAISHDIYHIYTGFDASPIGEFGVAAYTLVQYRDLLNVFVLSFVPLSLTNPLWTVPLLKALGRGLRMGIKGRAAIAYPVEAHWATPLSTVRQDLGLGEFFKPCRSESTMRSRRQDVCLGGILPARQAKE